MARPTGFTSRLTTGPTLWIAAATRGAEVRLACRTRRTSRPRLSRSGHAQREAGVLRIGIQARTPLTGAALGSASDFAA